MSTGIEIPIISTYKDKGTRAAQTSISKLTGTAKKLGLALGLALSVSKIVAFGKSSVKEFTNAEKAAAALQNTLRNTGNLLQFPDTEAGIRNLSRLSGVAGDALIPAFNQLYLTTGDINLAMENLNTAINVSRGSSNELGTVVDALTKGYAGNTKGLAGLNVGLNRAYLAAGDMNAITKELNNNFSGASAAFLDTYAGKIAILNNNFGETKEIVGQGLVMAFQEATGNRGVAGMTQSMDNLGYAIAGTSVQIGKLMNTLGTDIPIVSDILKRVVDGWSYILGVEETRFDIQNEVLKTNTRLNWEAMQAAAAQAKRNKEYLAFLAKQKKLTEASALAAKKRAAEEKKLAAERKLLEQAGSIFDLDQIQIYAALQNKITDQEKLRLSLQMALLQENVTEAQRLATELFKSQLQTTNLADAIAKLPRALYPFSGWSDEIDLLLKQIELLKKLLASMNLPAGSTPAGVIGSMGGYDAGGRYVGTPFGQAGSNVSTFIGSQGGYDMATNYVGTPFGQAQTSTTNIYVNGATQQLLNELRNGLIDSSASGSFATVNPNR